MQRKLDSSSQRYQFEMDRSWLLYILPDASKYVGSRHRQRNRWHKTRALVALLLLALLKRRQSAWCEHEKVVAQLVVVRDIHGQRSCLVKRVEVPPAGLREHDYMQAARVEEEPVMVLLHCAPYTLSFENVVSSVHRLARRLCGWVDQPLIRRLLM